LPAARVYLGDKLGSELSERLAAALYRMTRIIVVLAGTTIKELQFLCKLTYCRRKRAA
jgi:hypothetical protein